MFQNFTLIKELAWTDFKLRYNGSKLGFLWSFLKPLAMLLVLYFLFTLIMHSTIDNYLLFLLLGIVLWNYFVESTVISMNNMLSKREIILSIYFPRKALVISSNINAGFTLCFNMLIFFCVFFITGVHLGWSALLFVLLLIFLFLFSLGISYLLSAFFVRYRDVLHMWEIFTQVGFWVTPIIYASNIIPEKYSTLYFLNPMARIITYSRDVLIYGKTISLLNILLTFILCLSIYILGYYVYRHASRRFAEEI